MSKAEYSRRTATDQDSLFSLNEARLQAAIITGEPNPVLDFRCVPEKPGCTGGARLYRGRLSSPDFVTKLKTASKSGRAVFFMPAKTDGNGQRRANVTAARAIPLDLDKSPVPDVWGGPKPSVIVETSPGKHQGFWPIEPTENLDAVEDIARRAAARYGADSAVCDAPHVFRLAGFPHWKTGKPWRSRIVSAVDPEEALIDSAFGRFTLDDFKRLPPVAEKTADRVATDSDRRDPMEPETLESLLEHVPGESFEVDGEGDSKWRTLCTAASAATRRDPDALAVFQEWCAGDPKYSDDEQQAKIATRWNSFDPNKPGGITAGTLFKICRDHGVPDDVLREAFKRDAADDFAAFDDLPTVEKEARYKATKWHALKAEPDAVFQWQGVYGKRSYVLVYGKPKTGKTYLVLSKSLAIATGLAKFCGLKVEPGRALYIIAEGSKAGFRNRVTAWIRGEVKRANLKTKAERDEYRDKLDSLIQANFEIATVRVPINESKHVKELLKQNPGPWDFVVIDTMFRNTSGNVNDPKDANAFAAGVDTIREKTNATVCVVAHEGKDSGRGTFGSMIQTANADAILRIQRKGKDRLLTFEQLRDGDDSQPGIVYRLPTVLLGMTDAGEQEACYVEYVGRTKAGDDGDEKTDAEEDILKALHAGKKSQAAIADATGLTRQNVRTTIKRLRDMGHIEAEGLALTKTGRAIVADLADDDEGDFG